MSWVIYAALLVFCGAGIHIFGKLSSKFASADYVVLIACAAAFISSFAFLALKRGMPDFGGLSLSAWGYAAGLGVFITIAHLVMVYMYHYQGPISIAMPFARLGSIVLIVCVGLLFFGETLKPVNMLGLGLAAISMFLLTR